MKIVTDRKNLKCNILDEENEVLDYPNGFELFTKIDELPLFLDKKAILDLTEINIIGWNQELKKFIKIVASPSKEGYFVSSLNINILDYESDLHIGYVQSIKVKVIDNKCSISFNRYEYNSDKNDWFITEFK